MKKKTVIIFCIILFFWFFLDMTGLYFKQKCLVSRSFKDDWFFFVMYSASLLAFIFKEKIGKYVLNIWLSLWIFTQFLFHWLFTIIGNGKKTIFGSGEGKIDYFKGTIKIIDTQSRYFPDLYHVVLHILIIACIVVLNIYLKKCKKK